MKDLSKSKNYQNAQVYTGGSNQIPVDGYKCIIKNVKYAKYDWGDRIEMAFDITDGEYKDFFKKQFDANTSEDKKWKGVFRLSVPNDDGTEEDGWALSKFKTTMNHFEESNPGYTWNWDQNTLKGKKIGIIFRERYSAIGGRRISYSEANRTATIEDIESGNFKIPKPYKDEKWKNAKSYSNDPQAGSYTNDFVSIDPSQKEEIPF